MSELVSAVEAQALDGGRAEVIAHRRAYHRRLVNIATLEQLGTAVSTGYRSTEKLIADRDNLDTGDAKRLVAEAKDLCSRRSLHGEVLPALLPATGAAAADGLIDPAHIKIVRETMRHLAGLLTPPPLEELVRIEKVLAEHAQVLPPRMLRTLADGFIRCYDPDGAAPPDGDDANDELRMVRRKDGSLALKGRMLDPMDAEAFVTVIGTLAQPAGRSDERSLEKRQMDALNDLVQDARGPHGLATDARRDHTGSADNPADSSAESGAGSDAGESVAPTGSGVDGDADNADDTGTSTPGDDDTGDDDTGDDDTGDDDTGDDDTGDDDTGESGADGTSEADGEAGGGEPWALIPAPRRSETRTAASRSGKGWTERPGRALLTVTIDHRWLRDTLADQRKFGTLDSGHHVDAATLRRWACDADIVPIVLGSHSEPLD